MTVCRSHGTGSRRWSCGALLLAGGAGSALGEYCRPTPTIPEKPALAAAAPLDARLEAVVDVFRTGGQPAAARAAKAQRVRQSPQGALVVVGALSCVGATRTAIASAGGRVSGAGGRSLEASELLAKLRALARDVRVERDRRTDALHGGCRERGRRGDPRLLWHGVGFTGSGVKVAILDPGFQGYQALLGNEFPALVETHNLCDPGAITGATKPRDCGCRDRPRRRAGCLAAPHLLRQRGRPADRRQPGRRCRRLGDRSLGQLVQRGPRRRDRWGAHARRRGALRAHPGRALGELGRKPAPEETSPGPWSDPDSDDLLDWMSGISRSISSRSRTARACARHSSGMPGR